MTDMIERESKNCTVRDGKFVEPCQTLLDNVDVANAGFSKAKGIARWVSVSMETLDPLRSMIGIRTKAHPNGILFNHCPFCGEKIDAPFNSGDAA